MSQATDSTNTHLDNGLERWNYNYYFFCWCNNSWDRESHKQQISPLLSVCNVVVLCDVFTEHKGWPRLTYSLCCQLEYERLKNYPPRPARLTFSRVRPAPATGKALREQLFIRRSKHTKPFIRFANITLQWMMYNCKSASQIWSGSWSQRSWSSPAPRAQ